MYGQLLWFGAEHAKTMPLPEEGVSAAPRLTQQNTIREQGDSVLKRLDKNRTGGAAPT
jgi:hypothetical protein